MQPKTDFEKNLSALINQHSLEGESDTPDFILATYLTACLDAFNRAVNERHEWYQPIIPIYEAAP